MYLLVSAIGKLKEVGSRWSNIDISSMVLTDLFTQYEECQAVLSNAFYPTLRTLDLNDIRADQQASLLTFTAFLTSISDNSLPTVEGKKTIQTKWALYSDAFRAQYKILPVDPSANIGSTLPPLSERDWLSMTKTGVDYHVFYKSCLVSVNGLFHLTDTDGQRVFVVDGMKSCRQSGRNQLGVFSLQNLGELEFVPITAEMVHRRYAEFPLSTTLYLDTGVARPDQFAMLVLGGYLHVLDEETFSQINDTIFAINFQNFPLRDRWFESKNVIDLSSLEFEQFAHNPDQIGEADLHSDANLTKYATLSQSFLVFINNTELFKEKVSLRRTKLPNMYTSFIEPSYPLVTGAGRVSDYWKTKEDGQWSVTVNDAIRRNYTYNTTPDTGLISYDNSGPPYDPLEYSRSYFLKIGTDTLV